MKGKMSGTKNIPPLYSPKIPQGKSPYLVTGSPKRPSTGAKMAGGNAVKTASWGGKTKEGGSTINPTGANR